MAFRRRRASSVMLVRRHDEVAESLAVGPAYAAAQLVQVAQAEVLGLVDDDGVGVRDVQSVLYDGGAEHHVVVPAHEVQHLVFQHLGLHLPVGNADLHVGHQPVEDLLDGRQFLYLVVQEEYLPAAVEFVIDYGTDFLLVEEHYLRLHRDAVGRRGVDDAEVAGSQQGELQRARDGGRGEGEGIHGSLQFAQPFLCGNPEFLLLVYDQ